MTSFGLYGHQGVVPVRLVHWVFVDDSRSRAGYAEWVMG